MVRLGFESGMSMHQAKGAMMKGNHMEGTDANYKNVEGMKVASSQAYNLLQVPKIFVFNKDQTGTLTSAFSNNNEITFTIAVAGIPLLVWATLELDIVSTSTTIMFGETCKLLKEFNFYPDNTAEKRIGPIEWRQMMWGLAQLTPEQLLYMRDYIGHNEFYTQRNSVSTTAKTFHIPFGLGNMFSQCVWYMGVDFKDKIKLSFTLDSARFISGTASNLTLNDARVVFYCLDIDKSRAQLYQARLAQQIYHRFTSLQTMSSTVTLTQGTEADIQLNQLNRVAKMLEVTVEATTQSATAPTQEGWQFYYPVSQMRLKDSSGTYWYPTPFTPDRSKLLERANAYNNPYYLKQFPNKYFFFFDTLPQADQKFAGSSGLASFNGEQILSITPLSVSPVGAALAYTQVNSGTSGAQAPDGGTYRWGFRDPITGIFEWSVEMAVGATPATFLTNAQAMKNFSKNGVVTLNQALTNASFTLTFGGTYAQKGCIPTAADIAWESNLENGTIKTNIIRDSGNDVAWVEGHTTGSYVVRTTLYCDGYMRISKKSPAANEYMILNDK